MANNIDFNKIRADFPILKQKQNGKNLSFLDSAASAQKPQIVIDRLKKCYEEEYANIHRGVYYLSAKATSNFDNARKTVQKFINAKSAKEVIFVRGGTEAINLVTYSYGRKFLKKDDEVIISELEHHANIVPWQILRDELGIKIKIIPIDDKGQLLIEEYKKLISNKTKIVAITHTSNALGTITPIKEIIDIAHENNTITLVDGCQAVPHRKIDVQELDCDFYVFSGHKIYGPTAIGVLYGKFELLDKMPPYQTGGDMILSVTHKETIFNELPNKFEAGTPPIIEAVGLATAIDYLSNIGFDNIKQHEQNLLDYANKALKKLKYVKIYGDNDNKTGVISFNLENIHPHDIGTILDSENVAIRTGHHCAQPLMEKLNVSATARASFGIYSNKDDIDNLILALEKTIKIFS